ncbi:MAG: hypothetical protein LUD72_04550 [Bacteroidales bacterium]|nr:hypothetical protein [Bacteroidales bacterium]
MSIDSVNKAYELVRDYHGPNVYVKSLAARFAKKPFVLSEFEVEYILNNHDYAPEEVHKIVW